MCVAQRSFSDPGDPSAPCRPLLFTLFIANQEPKQCRRSCHSKINNASAFQRAVERPPPGCPWPAVVCEYDVIRLRLSFILELLNSVLRGRVNGTVRASPFFAVARLDRHGAVDEIHADHFNERFPFDENRYALRPEPAAADLDRMQTRAPGPRRRHVSIPRGPVAIALAMVRAEIPSVYQQAHISRKFEFDRVRVK